MTITPGLPLSSNVNKPKGKTQGMNFLNVDNQSLSLIVFAVLMSFLLSSILVFTYEKTSREVVAPDHFMQSMILMAIVTATIMQSIGDSMARGFGIFGALAILRFRTNIFNPRNISFIFAAMAVGIACGVYSFLNAVIGTISFSLVAFLLWLTPFSRKQNLMGQLRFELPESNNQQEELQRILRKHCKAFSLRRYRIAFDVHKADMVEYEYRVSLRSEMQGVVLSNALKELEDIREVRLTFTDTYDITGS